MPRLIIPPAAIIFSLLFSPGDFPFQEPRLLRIKNIIFKEKNQGKNSYVCKAKEGKRVTSYLLKSFDLSPSPFQVTPYSFYFLGSLAVTKS